MRGIQEKWGIHKCECGDCLLDQAFDLHRHWFPRKEKQNVYSVLLPPLRTSGQTLRQSRYVSHDVTD